MASIHKEILIKARPEHVWAAVRDVGAVHQRLAPGFVVDTRLQGDSRVVTFGNGVVARELIVDVDDQARRLAWAVVEGGRTTYYHASMQILAEGSDHSRLIWITDLLPNDLAASISAFQEQATATMKQTLEKEAAR